MKITVTGYANKDRILTIDSIIGGKAQQTQSIVPDSVLLEDQWMKFIADTMQPVVDSFITVTAFDPNTLVQAQADLSAKVITADALAKVDTLEKAMGIVDNVLPVAK